MPSNYVKACQQIVEDYRRAGGAWPAKKSEVAIWALANSRWDIPHEGKLRVCADDLAAAMREESIFDEAGRRVRVKHSAVMTRGDGEQGTFWDDLRTADTEFIRLSVAQRRNGIVADCHQLSNIVRYFNNHHPSQDHIQLVLDFTNDVRELDHLEGRVQRQNGGVTSASSTERMRRRAPLRRATRRAVSKP